MSIRNFDAVLVNLDGTVLGSELIINKEATVEFFKNDKLTVEKKMEFIQNLLEQDSKPMTMKGQIGVWLYSSNEEMTGNEKFERAMLAHKLMVGGDQDFDKDEINLMQKVVDKSASPTVVFQFRNYLKSAEKIT